MGAGDAGCCDFDMRVADFLTHDRGALHDPLRIVEQPAIER